MLQKTGPNRYRANEGDLVTIVAIAQNNNGVESATFRYGAASLPTKPVQGHPGCDFTVDRGVKTFGTAVLFANGATNAEYDLFEEDGAGNLVDLRFAVLQPFGPVAQFQVDGVPVAAVAAPPAAAAAMAPRALPGAPAARPRGAKKPAKKATGAAKRKTAKKKTAKKKGAAKTRAASKAGPRRTPARRRGR